MQLFDQLVFGSAPCARKSAEKLNTIATLIFTQSALPFLANLFEQLDLDLLNLKEPIILLPQQVIDFFVQIPDFEFGFEIDLVIVLRAQAISRFGAVLTHHNDRRLDSGQTREN